MHGMTRLALQQGLDARVISSWTAEVDGDGSSRITMTRDGLSGPVSMPEDQAVDWVNRLLSMQRHPSLRETASERAMRAWKMDEVPRTVHTVIPTL